jgi:hypothetical protein
MRSCDWVLKLWTTLGLWVIEQCNLVFTLFTRYRYASSITESMKTHVVVECANGPDDNRGNHLVPCPSIAQASSSPMARILSR